MSGSKSPKAQDPNRYLFPALIGFYVFIAFLSEPWSAFMRDSAVSDKAVSIAMIITLIGLIASCVGIILKKESSKIWFLFFNCFHFLFGCYAVYFYWDYWITTPTFFERIKAVLLPASLGVLTPLALFCYILRSMPGKDPTHMHQYTIKSP